MSGAIAAFALGAVLLLLGVYLTFGPNTNAQDFSVAAGEYESYSLPSWYYFPLGTQIEVTWANFGEMSNVTVRTCGTVTDGVCTTPGSILELGTGPSGSLTFLAYPGQVYGVAANAAGVLTVAVQDSSTYLILLFIVYTLGVICIGVGFMRYSMGIHRYQAI